MANKIIDITGKKFGKLTVLNRDGYTDGKRKFILWLCECECGNKVLRTASHLKTNNNHTCGECEKEKDEDIIGKQFGYWKVLKRVPPKSRKRRYLCRCKCGNVKEVMYDTLKLGTSVSCGCYHKEQLIERLTTHGQTGNRIMRIYYNIKSRCYDATNKRFNDYGGRGIKMCKDWYNSPEKFVKWSFNNGYNDELSIDRIDVDGNYEPDNCRWITMSEQSNNKRNSIMFTFFGITKNLKEWCIAINENYDKMYGRYYRGYETFRKDDVEKIKNYVENGGK